MSGSADQLTGEEIQRRLASADAAYQPFPAFRGWLDAPVDATPWDRAMAELQRLRGEAPAGRFDGLRVEALRAAAVDTGAIEGLYTTDRGFTLSVARGVIALQQAEVEKGADFVRHYQAQLAAFEAVLDVVTGDRPLTETLIRQLHELTTTEEDTYRVLTAFGVQERPLRRGDYKGEPNHVLLGDGTVHAYAPVSEVGPEIARLVEETRGDRFGAEAPFVRAAYVHHAFTWIHPFADGNGRVARLLASIYLLRAASIPLFVEAGDREHYLRALRAADRGSTAVWTTYIAGVAIGLVRELTAALGPGASLAEALTRVGDLTRPGPPPVEIISPSAVSRTHDLRKMVEELLAPVAGLLPAHVLGSVPIESPPARQAGFKRAAPIDEPKLEILEPDRRSLNLAILVRSPVEPLAAFKVVAWREPAGDQYEMDFSLDEFHPDFTPAARRRLRRFVETRMAELVGDA